MKSFTLPVIIDNDHIKIKDLFWPQSAFLFENEHYGLKKMHICTESHGSLLVSWYRIATSVVILCYAISCLTSPGALP